MAITITKEQLWEAVLGELELQLTRANFTTWFKNTFPIDLADGTLVVGVPGNFHKSYLESNCYAKISKALHDLSRGEIKKVSFIIQVRKSPSPVPTKPTVVANPAPAESTRATAPNSLEINPRYTFTTFIVGKNNELAHAACQAVARKPGEVYNPLFLYGGVGLGKTHLLQAIGNEIRANDHNKRILYISSERFTNDFIQAVRSGEGEKFKNLYRSVDLLLIDDIQFLAGKEQTQEEFFHTFNALHQNNKQIVITSDRPPKAIAALEHRLISRFEWGMIADIASPDLETRMAILEHKCREKNVNLSREAIQYIASHVHHNVRELEGVLNSITAKSQLSGAAATLDDIKQILHSVTPTKHSGAVTPKDVIQAVSRFYDVAIELLTGESRRKEYVLPRQVAMYLMREELRASYPTIGTSMGGRDHTTVMHGCDKITKVLVDDERLQKDLNLLRQQLYIT